MNFGCIDFNHYDHGSLFYRWSIGWISFFSHQSRESELSESKRRAQLQAERLRLLNEAYKIVMLVNWYEKIWI